MSKFIRLLTNEFVKLFARPAIYVIMILIPVIALGYSGILSLSYNVFDVRLLLEKPDAAREERISELSWNINNDGEDLSGSIERDLREIELLKASRDKGYPADGWQVDAYMYALSLEFADHGDLIEKLPADDASAMTAAKVLEAADKNDLIAYLTLRKENESKLGHGDEGYLAALDLRIKYGIPTCYEMFGYSDDWRSDLADEYQSSFNAVKTGINPSTGVILSDKDRESYNGQLAIIEERLKTDRNAVSGNSLVGFMLDGSSIASMISVFVIIIAATMMASEYADGTIKLLLISPHKRWKLFAAKSVSIFLTAVGLLLLLALSNLAIGSIIFGFKDQGSILRYIGGKVVETPLWLACVERYALELPPMLVMTAMAVMFAVLLRKSGAAIGVGVACYFGSSMISSLLTLLPYDFVRFVLFLNIDLSIYFPHLYSGSIGNMLTGATSQLYPDGMSFGFSIFVLALYFICFTYTALDSFMRRDVKQA